MTAIWTTSSAHNLNDIKVLQNRIVKTIKCLPVLQATKTIYSPDILPIDALGNFELILFIHKIRLGILKCSSVFPTIRDMHSYNTRQNTENNFYVDTVSTSRAQSNPFYKGLIQFNLLPEPLKIEFNIMKFKRNLKEHIFNIWLNTIK